MTLFPKSLEEHVYLHRHEALKDAPPVKQAPLWLRVIFMGFTTLCMVAIAGLIDYVFRPMHFLSWRSEALVFSVLYYLLGEHLIRRYQLYRYGVEEALTLGGAAFLYAAVYGFLLHSFQSYEIETALAALVGSVIFYLVYRRLGYFLAAVIAVGALCMVPTILHASEMSVRIGVVGLSLVFFGRHVWSVSQTTWKFERARGAWFAALLLALGYGVMNLRLDKIISWNHTTAWAVPPAPDVPRWFYWITYAVIMVVPVAALVLALRRKLRPVLDVSLVCGLLTILSNKIYLDRPRYDWDPMILGLLLVALARGVQVWLSKNKDRILFTPEKINDWDTQGLDVASLGPALSQSPSSGVSSGPDFGGGGSGGGGTTRGF